ncbi:MAG: MBL fold metallo-hydrolase [Chitinispirillaceae bacterium]
MIKRLSVTLLIDNRPQGEGLATEHGFSLWIEADDLKIVLDSGQSSLFLQNAQKLGIDLSTADHLVLSHGHYDHTGGVRELIEKNRSVNVFCHPGIFIPRYSRKPDGSMKPIGIGRTDAAALNNIYNSIHWTSAPTCISPDIGITGSIPRKTSFEDTGGKFYLDTGASVEDPLKDDMAMWFRTKKGLVVLTGCCHSGLVNTLEYVSALQKDTPVSTILGGFHLLNASEERMEATVSYLESGNIQKLIPCHCTGDGAMDFLKRRMGGRCVQGNTGARFVF